MLQETGRIISLSAIQEGVSTRTGNQWASQELVIETNERMPRKIAWTLFGRDKINACDLKMGENVTVIGYPESHKYGDNWYTELRATDVLDGNLSRIAKTLFQ